MNNEKKLQKKVLFCQNWATYFICTKLHFVCIFSMIVIQVGPGVKCRLAPVYDSPLAIFGYASRKFPINVRMHAHIS